MLIILNHKMNLNIEEIKKYEIILRDYNVVVMPQTPYMGLFTNGKYTLGSQCISEYNATGGVSAAALAHLKVKYVLVGHYERREIKRDTDEVIIDKILECINNNITPILCIGENSEDDEEILSYQISNVFDNLNIDLSKIIIAYEPIYNIGTNKDLNINIIKTKINFIKYYIKTKYNLNNKILYGGSVNINNIKELKKVQTIDGIIIGSASLNIENVIDIYTQVNN